MSSWSSESARTSDERNVRIRCCKGTYRSRSDYLIYLMGSICGKNAKRIIPKSKSANLGLQSGQSVNQPSVWQTIRQKHQDTMEPI